MFDPLAFPYVRIKDYDPQTGGLLSPVVTATEFYNPTQDELINLYHGHIGYVASIVTDDFETESAGLVGVVAGGRFGKSHLVKTSTNSQAFSIPDPQDRLPPLAPGAALSVGDQGVWRINTPADSGFDFEVQDASAFIGTGQFLLSCKVRLGNRAHMGPVIDPPGAPPPQNQGLIIGLSTRETSLPAFLAGSNKPNWQCWANNVLTDSGVAIDPAPGQPPTWFWLFIGRKADNTVRWYIKKPTDPLPVLVNSQVWGASFTEGRRYLRFLDNTNLAVKGDFLDIDFFARAASR